MAFSNFSTLHHKHPFSFSSNTLCKYPSSLASFNSPCFSRFPTFFSPRCSLPLKFSILSLASVGDRPLVEFSTNGREHKPSSLATQKVSKTGSRHSGFRNERLVKKSVEDLLNSGVEEKDEKTFEKGKNTRNGSGFARGLKMGSGNSFLKSRSNKDLVKVSGGSMNGDEMEKKNMNNKVVEKKLPKANNEIPLRLNLDMCSKTGDVMGAIKLYEWAQKEGIRLEQYHYTVILYLCSSAALGVVQPAKSGSGNRTLSSLTLSKVGSSENSMKLDKEFPGNNSVSKSQSHGNVDLRVINAKNETNELDGFVSKKESVTQFTNGSVVALDEKSHSEYGRNIYVDRTDCKENQDILVNEDFKKYALLKGFEIYEKMCAEKIPMNEATLTSVARMAMSMGDGDMAFDMVKQMKPLGINPRLRSYAPALSAFCNNVEIDKAFSVEKHMLDHGVYPEEPELEALLRVSIEAGKADKVYYLLHKLRTTVRRVSPSTAHLIITWFKSKEATRVGNLKLGQERIKKAMENGGGGWHGLGWLGRGKWNISSTNVGEDGFCKSCGGKLATIDLDPIETENFAESVAKIAAQREKNSSFQKFQKWLEYYGPFEAVIDAANVGLFSQRRFMPSKVNLIANGIRQKLPSKKWPLIVLHNKRVTGRKMDEPVNKTMVEKWKNADALYATPTGSNDDWYWLYAAIKFKCLLVTNDEMRDHTFQLLGNDFFPRWKERHQVHFSFSPTGPVFHMPPPCSVVIQESEKGHWHVPIVSEHGYEADRKWLCITRGNSKSHVVRHEPSVRVEESQHLLLSKTNSTTQAKVEIKQEPSSQVYSSLKHSSLKQMLSAAFSNKCSLFLQIEAAEKLGGCTIDFQI